jgi:hypothetical protein
MIGSAWNTQAGYARDLATFLTFLWSSRDGKSWREATEADHTGYLIWRRRDEHGPRVDDSTWDREVAAVNRFYKWQIRAGNVRVNPIPQRETRSMPTPRAAWRRADASHLQPRRQPGANRVAPRSGVSPMARCRRPWLRPGRVAESSVPRAVGGAQRHLLRPDGPHRHAPVRAGRAEPVRDATGSRAGRLPAILAAAGDRQRRLGPLDLRAHLGGLRPAQLR